MLYGFNADQEEDVKDFQQRIVGQETNIRQDEIQHAKNGFIGMLAGIIVGGVVGWLFLGPTGNNSKAKEIPVIRRPIVAAKVQPNDPGGMEIDNQNREIYHIVDKMPKANEEVNIIPAPEMPKLIVEESIPTPDNIENLVEEIEQEEETNTKTVENTNANTNAGENKTTNTTAPVPDKKVEAPVIKPEEKTKVADTKSLAAVKTNSRDKITIPQKINDIDIKLQNNVNSQKAEAPKATSNVVQKVEETKTTAKVETPAAQPTSKGAKGTWYAQIIASSSRSAVEKLWNQLSTKHTFLKSYSHEVEAIKAANGSTLYRLKVGAFKARKDAEALNAKLKENQISSIIKQN